MKRKSGRTAPKEAAHRGGIFTPLQPDEALAAIVGSAPIPRTEVSKRMWEYIKKNNLQDKVNRRFVNADEKLQVVFDGEKRVSMFTLQTLLSKHLSRVKEKGASE